MPRPARARARTRRRLLRSGRRLHGALPRLDVRDPDQLGVEQVIDFAENVHEVFMRDGLPASLVIAGAGR